MRARMAIAVSGVTVEIREVVLRDKPPEMLEVSPKATVPVLVHGQSVLEESLDIMRWALRQNDPVKWLQHVDEDLIAANDGPFKQHLDRYKYPSRYDLADGTEHRDAALPHLKTLNDKVAASGYLGSAQAGFTDIALFPFVRQFAATDPNWFASLPLPALHHWLDNLVTSSLFDAVMKRYPQWRAGDEPTYFP
jgi:glutathione S-transferase